MFGIAIMNITLTVIIGLVVEIIWMIMNNVKINKRGTGKLNSINGGV